MKRFFSIVLLLLFLYNVVGYYGLYLGLRFQSDRELRGRLDSNAFQESEMLSVKIPFTLPYQTDWKDYQRVDGDIEHNGEFYKLVKHKFERDTLYILYITDHRETDLFKSLVDFVHSNSDNPVSQKTISLIKSLAKDYFPAASSLRVASPGWCKDTQFCAREFQIILSASPVFSPPPEIFG